MNCITIIFSMKDGYFKTENCLEGEIACISRCNSIEFDGIENMADSNSFSQRWMENAIAIQQLKSLVGNVNLKQLTDGK